jgi:ribosomal protein S18 acetylase RimI-like enzyme
MLSDLIMSFENSPEIIDVNKDNVEEVGFFCLMSRKQGKGYRLKLRWIKECFSEGMKIKMLKLPERGFIEYIPGEYAWRAVEAKGYMFIHCLWVVGKSKARGHATLLLNECVEDAIEANMAGVAIATTPGNWLIGKKLFKQNGFESVDQAPPAFELMVKKFRDSESPCFSGSWEEKMSRCGKGLTIFRSNQCPYLEDAVNFFVDTADELSIPIKVVELTNAKEVRELALTAYGVFNVVYDGKPFSYHYLLKKDILKKLYSSMEKGD